MAAWFAIDTELEGHPKFQALIAERGWSPTCGVAYLYRFWCAVRTFAPDGDVSRWDDRYLARTMLLTHGKVAGLRVAMVTAGFLDHDGDRVMVHGWDRRNGRFLKDAERKRASRRASGSHPETGTSPPENRHLPPQGREGLSRSNGDARQDSLRVTSKRPWTGRGQSADGPRRAGAEQDMSTAASSPSLRSVEDLARCARSAGAPNDTPEPVSNSVRTTVVPAGRSGISHTQAPTSESRTTNVGTSAVTKVCTVGKMEPSAETTRDPWLPLVESFGWEGVK